MPATHASAAPRCLWIGLVLLLTSATHGAAAAQGAPEVIHGTVVTDSGRVVRDAEVVVTRSPDRATRTTRSDSAGRFSITFPDGTGDYLLHVHAPGWRSFRQRLTRKDAGALPAVEVKLVPQPLEMAGVTIRGRRERPTRNTDLRPETGGAERMVDGVTGALSPDQMGDLAAMAAVTPGVIAGPDGMSVLGLGAGQSNATLNGMSFAGSDIPREARTWTRISTSTYDPARGGFSGGQIAVDLVPGNVFSFRRSHLTLDAPPLQYADPVSARLGGEFTNVQASAGGDGMLVKDKYFYNVAAQASRRAADAVSLTDADADVLRLSGVAADSVTRFLQLLSSAGVPTGTGLVPASRLTDNVSLIGRIDRTPFGNRTWGLTAYAKRSQSDAFSLAPTMTAAHSGRSSSTLASLQGVYSFYRRKNTLNETRTAFTLSQDDAVPYLRVPGGRVAVSSSFPDGTGGLSTLAFGGNGALTSDRSSWTWETANTTQWFSRYNDHRVKIYAQSRLDGYRESRPGDQLGTFSYHSLQDLAANRPSGFSRVLDSPSASGGAWSGAFAVGDLWRKSPTLQVLYGARVEANSFTSAPPHNPAVLDAFGVRTENTPGGLHLSPRLGFTWIYSGAKNNRSGYSMSTLGTRMIGPRGYLRGGVGEFRNLLPATLLSPAQLNTGLAGSMHRIQCVGPAVPSPDWAAFAADPETIPEACAGDAAPVFTDAAPVVHLFDPDYAAPRSWRGNLAWSSSWKKLGFTVEGIYSLNLDQPGIYNLNFAGEPRFRLANEGNRPVFVSPASIVAATGAVSPVEARLSRAFGAVMSHRSDLRSESRQLTITATPDLSFGRYVLNVAYTLSDTRAQFRGFDGATFGAPTAVEWAPAELDSRHQLAVQAGWANRWFNISLFGRLNSGTPFTPLLGGDVNGDGLFNDRAFVFDPGETSSPTLASGMDALLASAPGWARSCLEDQLGQASVRGSCRGPWTQSLNARLGFSRRLLPTGRRLNIGLNLANPLGGLDQLLHGSQDLRGWGTAARPDPILYRVRGFDSAAQSFRYEVNPRFGDTRPSRTAVRAPFRITLDISLDWGKPLPVQQIERWIGPGRRGSKEPRLSADSLQKLYARNVPDLYRSILQESDSLLLTPEQTEALQAAQRTYREKMDRVWKDLADYLAALPDRYDAAAALKRQEDAIDQGWEISRQEGPTVKSILSPVQLKLLPSMVNTVINAKEKLQIRMFVAG